MVAAVVFLVWATVLALIFLDITATNLGKDNWQGYFAMAVYGLGAAGCFIAGRHYLRRAETRAAR